MSSANESNTNFVNKVVHTSAKGRRYYHVDNDEAKRRIYCCTGKDDTCTNQPIKGGICIGCGATQIKPRCKGFTEEGGPCPNFSQRGGFCKTHNPNPLICTGVKSDGSPCTNRANSGELCDKHKNGSRYGTCPCGRQLQTCPECNPLGNLVKRIRTTLRDCTRRRFIRDKPLGDPPDWLGCSWEDFFVWIKNLFEAGMTWDNYGKGKGKWNFDHKHAFFDKEDPAKTEDEIYRRSHYTNVRPMWSEKNRSKGNR